MDESGDPDNLDPSDKEILDGAQRGDKECMRMLYLYHRDYLYSVAMALLRDSQRAEDAVQDVFVTFVRGLQAFRLSGSLRSYLSVSICNRSLDIVRGEGRRKKYESRLPEPRQKVASPESLVSTRESIEALRVALTEVPIEQREVLLLRCRVGLSFREIALHQRISSNTVKARYLYGLMKLREIMGVR